MRKLVTGSLVSWSAALLVAGTATAISPYGFVLHMTPASYSSCGGLDDATLTCDPLTGIDPVGDGTLPQQFAWLIAYGWEDIVGWPEHEGSPRGIGAAQFGIHYDIDVVVAGWTLCTGGAEIPQNDPVLGITWPDSDSGNAVTWVPVDYYSPSGFAKIGFFAIPPGSVGRLTVVADPRIGEAQIAAGDATVFTVPPAAYSSADVDGSNPDNGRAACRDMVPVEQVTWGRIKSMF
jgi:hypothetical protein